MSDVGKFAAFMRGLLRTYIITVTHFRHAAALVGFPAVRPCCATTKLWGLTFGDYRVFP